MKFEGFSAKQLQVLNWWCARSPFRNRDAIICDGAVRSGKSLCLSVSFILWSMAAFSGQDFALCGKTITSLRRNVVLPLMGYLREMGFACTWKSSGNLLEIRGGGRWNRYYLFGGRDEGSAALIQGITLAGVLLDEVVLMPRSFVEQALARCSVEGSKFWFNCNPQHPAHWFYTHWIERAGEKNALYLHFTMRDNPALSRTVRERYERLYTGVFYQRYVLGEWVAAQGSIYPMFSTRSHVVEGLPPCRRFFISCDYGTVNPASFGLWGEHDGIWYRLREYYHDARRTGMLKTDEEYADALEELAVDVPVEAVLVDPSAASFIQCLRRRGRFRVVAAQNNVRDGIRLTAGMLKERKLLFHAGCVDTIREFGLYQWDLAALGEVPKKENDHAMDDMRYFVLYISAHGRDSGFWAGAVTRGAGQYAAGQLGSRLSDAG